eukprot:GFUD01020814.1.p1 GENE.GFUD01020814.1~~GFUD01020814.1.p1  ORF type:complete len:788 (+),score=177.59 GFUD01020814.1:86-2449(+)
MRIKLLKILFCLKFMHPSVCMDQDGSDFDIFYRELESTKTNHVATLTVLESESLNSEVNTNVSSHIEGRLTYEYLSTNKHGRHLLLISLLDEVRKPYWFPRSGGVIQLFLPQSLAPTDQPPPVATGQLLQEIRTAEGQIRTREEVIKILNDKEDFILLPGTTFSRFNIYHMAVVRRLVSMFTTEIDFHSMLSMMVMLKEFLSEEMFVDSVYAVIQLREDVGFIIPNVVTVQPEDYFPGALIEEIILKGKKQSEGGRVKRQLRYYANSGELEINWSQEKYRTIPEHDPECQLWYFREDPLVNANHFHWHQVLSNTAKLSHTSHSSNLDRRGEMFYFMHRQLLCRINAERLSLGMDVIEPYGPEQWAKPFYPGYDPKLRTGAVDRYSARPPGATMFRSDQYTLRNDMIMIQTAIDQMSLSLFDRTVKMEYRNGVDTGISDLGDVVEAYVKSMYGDLHNGGHTIIARLHKTGGAEGVMSTPNVAVRDPIFSRWHKFVDDGFQQYKKKLGFYEDADLDFPGVMLTGLTLQSQSASDPNALMTYFNQASIKLNSIDFKTERSSSVKVKYTRLDHVPFTYTITAQVTKSTRGMVRIFLIPTNIPDSPNADITQLAIEMDRFHVTLAPGDNTLTRKSTESSFVTKPRVSLRELQDMLRTSQISEDEFNWSGCGWPREMALPRGKEDGMPFQVLAVLSPLLESDRATSADWGSMEKSSWSWCGVRTDKGGMPDSRPMGFPLDRPPPSNNWTSLLRKDDGSLRRNFLYQDITITFSQDQPGPPLPPQTRSTWTPLA